MSHLFILPVAQFSDVLILPWSQLSTAQLDPHPILSQISPNQDSWRPSRIKVYFTSSNIWYQNDAGYDRISSILACFMRCHDLQFADLTRDGQSFINSTFPAGSLAIISLYLQNSKKPHMWFIQSIFCPFLSICRCRCLIHKWQLGLRSKSWVLLIHRGHKEGLNFSQWRDHGGDQHNRHQWPCTRVHPRPLLCWYPGGCCSWGNHPHGMIMNQGRHLYLFF